ncbi:MAG: FapA family protein [Desulfovibrionaceae bacterium]
MPYVLHHHFEPDMAPRALKPRDMGNGVVDHYDLGYVQNAIVLQVLAEFTQVDDAQAAVHDSRLVFPEPVFPMGPNCRVNPGNPLQLLASANGHVCYENGKITVKTQVSIDSDIDFHTGNILFVGDLSLEKNVRSGFEIQARTIRAHGVVEGATLKADKSIVCHGGIKGGKRAVVTAGANIRAAFCENAELAAQENILIDGSCLHSQIYVGKQCAIKGRLQGGHVRGASIVYVGEVLGGGSGTITTISLGYDPFLIRQAEALDASLLETKERLQYYKSHMERCEDLYKEFAPRFEKAEKKRRIFEKRREELWQRITASETLATAKVVVPGEVRPGVEISIGMVSFRVNDFLQDVAFSLADDEIRITSPALIK